MSFPESGIRAVVENLNGFLSDVGKMDKAIQGIGADTSAIRNWNDSITTVTANIAKVVATTAAAGTAAITAFVVDSTKKSADLESSLSGIAAVLNKGTEAVGPLKDLILDLGIDPALKVSATEAADAVEMLARNGLDMTEIMDGAARSTVLLANATGADFGTAADIATDAMAIFNIQAKDMDEAVNGITGVTTASKFSIDDYKLALAQAGGVAGAVGVDFDDFNTTIAGIAPLFASGSDAGTSFKTFLQRLIPASEPAADAMKDLGLFTGLTKKEFESAQDKIQKYQEQLSKLDPTSKNYAERAAELDGKIQVLKNSLVAGSNAFFDANGQMKDMDQIAGILQEALSGLSGEKKNDALATIFGTDAMRAAVGVANLGTKGYQELGAQIAEIDAGNQAKTRMDNLSGSLEILAGIVETLQIRIGDKFNPVFKGLVDQTSDFLSRNSDRIVNFFGKLADMVKVAVDKLIPMVESWLPKLEEGVDGGAASMEGMIDKVGGIIKGVKDFTDKIIGVVKPVADWITQNYELEDILNGIMTVITVSLIPSIVSLATTLAPVILLFTSVAELSSRMTEGQKQFAIAIGVAVFALPPLITAISGVVTAISTVVGFISGTAGIIPALGALLNPVGLAVAAVAGLGLAWATDFGGIRTTTTEVLGEAGDKIKEWSGKAAEKFGEFQKNVGTTLATWSEDIGTTFSKWSENVGTTLSGWAEVAAGAFVTWVGDTAETIDTWAKNASDAFDTWSGNVGTTLATWSENIGKTLSSWAGSASEVFDSWVKGVESTISTWGDNIETAFSTVTDGVKTTLSTWGDKLKEGWRLTVEALRTAWAGGMDAIKERAESIKAQVGDAFESFKSDSSEKIRQLVDGVSGFFLTLKTNVVEKIGELATTGAQKFFELKDKIVGKAGELITDGVQKFIDFKDRVISKIGELATTGAQKFAELREKIVSRAGELITDGVQKFIDFKDRVISKIKELVTDGVDRFKRFVSDALEVFNVQKWIQAGADLIGGLLKGLRDAVTAPLRWITDFAGNLVGAFKDALGIRSPSTVFDEFGVNIMEGLEGGLEARSGGVLSFMGTFSDALVATTAEAQRQADKNFAALTESATAAYNGYVVIAGDIARLSQQIDQSAIAAAEAARKAAEAAKQAEKDKAAAEVAAVDKYFGFGRVSELIDQIKGIVNAAFEVNGTAVRSLGIDLSNLTTSGATNDAIARLQLLAGTIQQNAGAATNVDDRNRLSSLYSDLTGRILPLLKAQANTLKAEEDKAKADAQAAATPATLTALNQAIKDLNSYVETLRTQGIAAYAGPIKDMYGNSLLTPELQAVFDQVNQNVMTAASALYGDVRNLAFKGTTLGAEGLAGSFGNFQRVLDFVANVTDALKGTSFGWLDTSVETGSQNLFSSLASSFVQALPALGGNTSNLTVNTGDINNGMDLATLQALIQQAVAEALP